jgi:hypothetical protein
MSQRVFWVDLEGSRVESLGFRPLPGVEVDGSEVHQGPGRAWIQLGRSLVRRDRLLHGCADLFELETFLEPDLGGFLASALLGFFGFLREREQPFQLPLIEVEEQLAGDGLHVLTCNLDADPAAFREDLEFAQRITDVRELFT